MRQMVSWWVQGRGGVFLGGDVVVVVVVGPVGLGVEMEMGTKSSLGLTSGEGGFEVAGEGEDWGWGGFGGGRSGGEEGGEEDDGLSMDFCSCFGGFWCGVVGIKSRAMLGGGLVSVGTG